MGGRLPGSSHIFRTIGRPGRPRTQTTFVACPNPFPRQLGGHLVRSIWTSLQAPREGTAIAQREGYPHVLAGCTFVLGWALGLHGKFAEGLALIRQGIAGWTLAMNQFQHIMLAEVCLKAGQPLDTLESLAKFAELATPNGERHW